MNKHFYKFAWSNSGNIAVIASILMVPLITAIGAAVDYTSMTRIRSNMQQAADSAALASTRELRLTGAKNETIKEVAYNFVWANALSKIKQNTEVGVTILDDKKGVTVTLSYKWRPMILHHLNKAVMPIVTTATAQLAGETSICILSLAEKAPKSVFLDHNSSIVGNNCGVYANSTDPDAIRADDKGTIKASVICSSGGVTGTSSAFSPRALTDCPAIPDPLLGRAEPSASGCDYNKTEIVSQKKTLFPGVYCGGLKIAGNSNVSFEPGIYSIKGDKFIAQDDSTIVGINVGFYLADDAAYFEFGESTTIELTAPENGLLAGILMFESRSVTDGRKHQIYSNNARILIGTFYLPRSTLVVSTKAPVASDSAYTAVIAHAIELLENPTLVLNTNYDDTNVPVPEGLSGTAPRLSR
ncbi:MAG: pilus assembly protein [Rhizobiaceae bacterium]|nr:pilus assembly protein [Rhizobiaceae bacterium]